jgi:hypothetical protein
MKQQMRIEHISKLKTQGSTNQPIKDLTKSLMPPKSLAKIKSLIAPRMWAMDLKKQPMTTWELS